MDSVLFAADVEKYSMGRSTGLRAKNWKTRHLKITRSRLTILEKAASPTPKFDIPIGNISLVFENPTSAIHPEASGSYASQMLAIRLFDNGVFTLLVRAHNDDEKAKWLAALREATSRVKGCQTVSD